MGSSITQTAKGDQVCRPASQRCFSTTHRRRAGSDANHHWPPMLLHTCLLVGIMRIRDLFLFAQWAWLQKSWELNLNTQSRIFIDAPILWTASRLARKGSVEAVVASGMSESVNLLPSGRKHRL